MKTTLSLLSLFLAAATTAQDESVGTHSTTFDPKYDLPDKLLVNPQTHPALFSVSLRYRPVRSELY